MIDVERIELRLPHGWAARAPEIARELAAALAPLAALGPIAVERLSVGPVRIAPGATDRAVGAALAGAVRGRLERR